MTSIIFNSDSIEVYTQDPTPIAYIMFNPVNDYSAKIYTWHDVNGYHIASGIQSRFYPVRHWQYDNESCFEECQRKLTFLLTEY